MASLKDQLTSNKNNYDRKINELNSNIDELKGRISELTFSDVFNRKTISDLINQIKDITQQNDVLNARINEYDETNELTEKLKIQIETLTENKNKLNRSNSEQAEQIKDYEIMINKLNDQVNNLQNGYMSLIVDKAYWQMLDLKKLIHMMEYQLKEEEKKIPKEQERKGKGKGKSNRGKSDKVIKDLKSQIFDLNQYHKNIKDIVDKRYKHEKNINRLNNEQKDIDNQYNILNVLIKLYDDTEKVYNDIENSKTELQHEINNPKENTNVLLLEEQLGMLFDTGHVITDRRNNINILSIALNKNIETMDDLHTRITEYNNIIDDSQKQKEDKMTQKDEYQKQKEDIKKLIGLAVKEKREPKNKEKKKTLNEQIGRYYDDVTALDNQISSLNADIRSIDKLIYDENLHIKELYKQIAKQDINKLYSLIEKYNNNIKKSVFVINKINDIKKRNHDEENSELKNLNKRLGELNENIKDLDMQIGQIGRLNTGIDGDIKNIMEKFEKRKDIIQDDKEKINKQINDLQRDLDYDNNRLKDLINKLDPKISKLKKEYKNLKLPTNALEDDVSEIKRILGQIEEKLPGDLKQKLKPLEKELTDKIHILEEKMKEYDELIYLQDELNKHIAEFDKLDSKSDPEKHKLVQEAYIRTISVDLQKILSKRCYSTIGQLNNIPLLDESENIFDKIQSYAMDLGKIFYDQYMMKHNLIFTMPDEFMSTIGEMFSKNNNLDDNYGIRKLYDDYMVNPEKYKYPVNLASQKYEILNDKSSPIQLDFSTSIIGRSKIKCYNLFLKSAINYLLIIMENIHNLLTGDNTIDEHNKYVCANLTNLANTTYIDIINFAYWFIDQKKEYETQQSRDGEKQSGGYEEMQEINSNLLTENERMSKEAKIMKCCLMFAIFVLIILLTMVILTGSKNITIRPRRLFQLPHLRPKDNGMWYV